MRPSISRPPASMPPTNNVARGGGMSPSPRPRSSFARRAVWLTTRGTLAGLWRGELRSSVEASRLPLEHLCRLCKPAGCQFHFSPALTAATLSVKFVKQSASNPSFRTGSCASQSTAMEGDAKPLLSHLNGARPGGGWSPPRPCFSFFDTWTFFEDFHSFHWSV